MPLIVRTSPVRPVNIHASGCAMRDFGGRQAAKSRQIALSGGLFPYDRGMGRSAMSLEAINASLRARPADAARPVARPAKGAPAQRGAGQIRIIGGQWRRRLLPVAAGPGVPPGLRPTPDRVRETLFNWLGQDLGGWHCMDLCAGTGALGFEAASRGAARVLMLEQHAALVKQLRQLQTTLQADAVQVRQGDALTLLRDLARQQPASQDLILLDPPYEADWYGQALQLALPLLRAGGYLYLEAGRAWDEAELQALGWQCWRHLQAGAVHAHLLRPLQAAD